MILCNEIIEIITEWSIAIRNLVKERYLNFINCMHEDSPKKKPHMPSELKKKKKIESDQSRPQDSEPV